MRASLLSILLLFPALPLMAQQGQSLCPSQVVHWQTGRQTMTGKLLDQPVADDSLQVQTTVAPKQRTLSLDTPGLACRTRASSKGHGALVGLLVGAGVGAALGFISGDDTCSSGDFCILRFTAPQKAVFLGSSLGLIGTVIGAIAAPGAQWQALRPATTSKKTIDVSALLQGNRVGLRLGF